MSRSDVIQNINKAQKLVNSGDFSAASELIRKSFDKVIEYNFYTLLDTILDLKEKFDQHNNHHELAIFDVLLRQSPFIRSSKANELFNHFLEVAKNSKESYIPIHSKFLKMFPLSQKLRFLSTEFATGKNIEYDLRITSQLSNTLHCDDISIEFSVDNGETYVHSIGPYDLSNKIPTIIKSGFLPPSKYRTLRASSVNLRVGNVTITFESNFKDKLLIVPDENSCRIDVSMPTQCVIGTNLPLKVTLNSGDLKLHDLHVSFIHDNAQSSILINGTYNGKPIEKDNLIGEMEPNSSITLDLSIITHVALQTAIILTVSFQTDEFGAGIFRKPLNFNFISPFKAQMNYMNDDFEVLSAPVIHSRVSSVIIETSLTNVLSCPITIQSITGTIDFFQLDYLPCVIKPLESMNFLGQVKTPGTHEILVDFTAENIDKGAIEFKTPEIKQDSNPLVIKYICPDKATIKDRIDCKLVIERDFGLPTEDEIMQFTLLVEKTPNFFLEGPGKINFCINRSETREFDIGYYPLHTGSFYLPKIHIPELSKSFVSQIIIAYQ